MAMNKPKKSNTRLRIDKFFKCGLNPMITNAYANERLDGHGESFRSNITIKIIEYLKGVPIVAHGAIAHKFVSEHKIDDHAVYKTKHLRLLSYDNVIALAHKIKNNS